MRIFQIFVCPCVLCLSILFLHWWMSAMSNYKVASPFTLQIIAASVVWFHSLVRSSLLLLFPHCFPRLSPCVLFVLGEAC